MPTMPTLREAESDLVRGLKERGLVVVGALSRSNLNAELAELAVRSAEERYMDLKIIPVECVLKKGYSLCTDVSHVVYADFYEEAKRKEGKKIGVVVKDSSGLQSITTL